MPWRFRRTLRLAPGLRVNLSKRRASLSIGGHGLTENLNRAGGRTTIGLPGTGLSYSTRRRRARGGGSVLGGLVVLMILGWLALRLFG